MPCIIAPALSLACCLKDNLIILLYCDLHTQILVLADNIGATGNRNLNDRHTIRHGAHLELLFLRLLWLWNRYDILFPA